jgi:hypothetical protein
VSFIFGMKIPDVPYQAGKWRREHPGEHFPDGHVYTRPWPAGPLSKRRDQVISCQFKAGRARRTLRGTGEQVAKATRAVAGLALVKPNWFIKPGGAANRGSSRSENPSGWQKRPPGQAPLPPQARLHRRRPGHRVRCPRRHPGGPGHGPAGRSGNPSAQPVAAAPPGSTLASMPSPPPARFPATSAKPSTRSTAPADPSWLIWCAT